MPITLGPITRRQFLSGSVAAGTALALQGVSCSEPKPQAAAAPPALGIALFSDIHINADPTTIVNKCNMFDHFKQSASEMLALPKRPAVLLINGDCAHTSGEIAEYHRVLELVTPLRVMGIPVHMGLGNHDSRANFWSALPKDDRRVNSLDDRQVLVLEFPQADWIMLDSLQKTSTTPGELGATQIAWLTRELDERKDRRVIVMVHHQPSETLKPGEPVMPDGLTDTQALLDTLIPRRQVKALLYGHTHTWRVKNRQGLHCVNLPAVAYPFIATEPTGWVAAHVTDNAMSLKLYCTDHAHPKHLDQQELKWRA